MSTIIRPLVTSKTGSTFVLRIVALRALNSLSADRTSNELSDGTPGVHSRGEEDPCSREVDKLSSDSHSDASSSDEELDSAGDSASISTTSATALGLDDLCRLSLGSFFGVPPRGVPLGVPRGVPFGVVFGVAPRLLGFGFPEEMEAS